ncbi:MAG: lipopolysaccharide export system permease [Gallionellaceae bacterium]|nr:MAG: lipopolysaccharide export system permease [Gallionellaceae bacterium]
MPDYPQSHQQKSKSLRSRAVGGVFYRSLVREFAVTGAFVFSILLGIIVFTQLIRLLGDSVSGLLAVDGVMALVGFSALNYLPILLSVSLYLSVLLTLTRSYRDSEMVVWFSSGIGLTRWIRPVMGFAVPVVCVIALLSLVLTPWAKQKAEEFKSRLDTRDDVALATPGAFRESKQADRVFFLENVDATKNRVGNVFVQSVQNSKEGTMVAKEGLQETAPNGDRFLVLLNGTRYEGVPGQHDFKIVEFERYSVRIEAAEVKEAPPNYKSFSTLYLLQNPNSWNISELEWRIGLPLSALILALLAIPFSFVNPRAGRSLNMIVAIVIYMAYNNMMGVSATWVGQGKIGVVVGLWAVHGVMVLLMVLMFYKRLSVFSWRRLVR